jgi:hypothetical protein
MEKWALKQVQGDNFTFCDNATMCTAFQRNSIGKLREARFAVPSGPLNFDSPRAGEGTRE